MKKILHTQKSDKPHWVGDGFPVRSIFSYNDLGKDISPFLLLDYAGPTEFPPSENIRGVGEHPHRGFETVTIVYDGEVEHKDSAGGGGIIKEGDVQWMTAASGIVHEEKHGKKFAQMGGPFEMVQLWVNLPKKDKMNPPRYQAISKSDIPIVEMTNGIVRVIAGNFEGASGAAKVHTPINLWDIRLKNKADYTFRVPSGQTAAIFVLSGQVTLNDTQNIGPAELALLNPLGEEFNLKSHEETKILFLGGAAIDEPIVGYGPFVMNTKQEIHQAFIDFENGKMGKL